MGLGFFEKRQKKKNYTYLFVRAVSSTKPSSSTPYKLLVSFFISNAPVAAASVLFVDDKKIIELKKISYIFHRYIFFSFTPLNFVGFFCKQLRFSSGRQGCEGVKKCLSPNLRITYVQNSARITSHFFPSFSS